jgi:hypothetical protein
MAYPFVEDGVQKFTISRGGHRPLVRRMIRITGLFHQRQKLEVLPADLLQVTVDLRRIFDIDVVDDAEQVDVHLGTSEHLESLHHLLVRRLLALGDTVMVV